MKVKIKCIKCKEKHYARAYDLKTAKSIKKSYTEGIYICGNCLGYGKDSSIGILAG